MLKSFIQWFAIIWLCGQATFVAAHTYFFGLTDLSVNPKNQHIEIIHQLTAHDVENAIAEQRHISFSTEHPKYDLFIQHYIEQYFSLIHRGQPLKLQWVGLELDRGKIIIYQESAAFNNSLISLSVKNELLMSSYSQQVNTVNFSDDKVSGSLTFTDNDKVANIANNN